MCEKGEQVVLDLPAEIDTDREIRTMYLEREWIILQWRLVKVN